MLSIKCPVCGVHADETELSAGGEAHISRASVGSTDAEFEEYMFLRANVRGINLERWRHSFGCGKWFHVARNSTTNVVLGTYSAQTVAPTREIVAMMEAHDAIST